MASSNIVRYEKRRRDRQEILDLYGRVCANCGYKRDERVLQLDHVNGHPDKKYRSGWVLYAAILSGKIPMILFQILCANCNFLKRLTTPSENGTIRVK